MTRNQKRNLSLVILLTITGIGLLLTATWLNQRHKFLTRGIPELTTEPVQDAGTVLGINVDLEQYNDVELAQTLDQLSQLNIKYLKQSFYFTPDFSWSETERIFTAVAQYPNLQITPLLDGDPATQFAPPSDINDYAAWAAEFAGRFGNQIDAYIIWDEPNITTHWGGGQINPSRYGAMLTAANQAIKTVDPQARIVAAPLAPTAETNQINIADDLYLQALYDNGSAASFDIAAAKPYGFNSTPDDRTVSRDTFNLSRAILLREVMVRNGDEKKPLWAGNWGWNRNDSIWGGVSTAQQIDYATASINRAQQEWPWMGHMYLQHWDPADPTREGFTLADHPNIDDLSSLSPDPQIAHSGYHFADPADPAQQYQGDWEFSPQFGADVSQQRAGETADSVTFTFYGTDAGLRVRRANYRARFYVLIDGEPANALPPDETTYTADGRGSALVLNTNNPDLDTIETIPVAQNLPLGQHTMTVTAHRGWDQFPLNGFVVANQSGHQQTRNITLLILGAIGCFISAGWLGRTVSWHTIPAWQYVSNAYQKANFRLQLSLTVIAGILVASTGWLTWGQQAAGLFRRWGDATQLAVVLSSALVFYLTPWFFVYLGALFVLYLLLVQRPAWGLALTVLTFPFYVSDTLKPIYTYRFSAVEIFTLVTLAAAITHFMLHWAYQRQNSRPSPKLIWHPADYAAITFTAVATLSLFFTDQLAVATNEWRVIIIEPFLFYCAFRLIHPTREEFYIIIRFFIASGVIVALIGLTNYALGTNLITAEGGLMRLRAHYGSPNNVALYLGRILPITLSLWLFNEQVTDREKIDLHSLFNARPQRWLGLISATLLGAILLTFSKGGLFVGLPVTAVFLFVLWQHFRDRTAWPWLMGSAVLAVMGYFALLEIPSLAPRLDITGATSDFRINLWRASINMWRDHPWLGVGLDNFLYEYRGRYILANAWQEPSLNHPHQIILDFGTRLGILGLIVGTWLFSTLLSTLYSLLSTRSSLVIGLLGATIYILAHGLVDHSFFLIDLAFVFYLLLGSAVWLSQSR